MRVEPLSLLRWSTWNLNSAEKRARLHKMSDSALYSTLCWVSHRCSQNLLQKSSSSSMIPNQADKRGILSADDGDAFSVHCVHYQRSQAYHVERAGVRCGVKVDMATC